VLSQIIAGIIGLFIGSLIVWFIICPLFYRR